MSAWMPLQHLQGSALGVLFWFELPTISVGGLQGMTIMLVDQGHGGSQPCKQV